MGVLSAYISGRGKKSCSECVRGLPQCFQDFAKSQDSIGWNRFMEGMVSIQDVAQISGLRG